ncbi:MAG: 2-hydroxyacid dehydrogenase [Nocardioides sp.]
MSDERPLVWLPFDTADLGEVPATLRYVVHDPAQDGPPGSWAAEVRFYVPSYSFGLDHAALLAAQPRLEVVQTLTAGVDHLRRHVPGGVTLCNGRGIHNASTAELAVTLTLASLRDIPGFVDAQRAGRWAQGWRPSLADSTVLIVGYGDIGADLEKRLLPFEVEVLRVARSARPGVHTVADLPDLLPRADVVVLVVPGTAETRGLVDADFLARMRPGALLVNVARGPVVVTDDLLAALNSGRVRAALDVTDPEPLPPGHPLWSAPNLLLTPHVGGATPAMWPRAHRLVREQLTRWAAGEPLANVMTGDY